MNIIGLNPGHHGSVCFLENGDLKFFIQEERLTKKKYDPYPFHSFISLLQQKVVDWVTWASPSIYHSLTNFHTEPYWYRIATKFHPDTQFTDNSNSHHYAHISHAFYNSGFDNAIGIVIDGAGSLVKNNTAQETETIFKCSYPSNFEILYKNSSSLRKANVNIGKAYETITMHLGWRRDEAGKTMGLASYGKQNYNIPPLFKSTQGDLNILYTDVKKRTHLPHQNETFIDEEKNPQLKLPIDPREWHYDESKITDLEKDLAWKIQNDTQQLVGNYIEKAIQETGLKQVCCAGGYFLNCVTNYYLLKRFPDIKFYFEPISYDAGTAIGAAKLVWHYNTQDTTIRPLKSLYLGKQYSKEELLEGIKKYVDTP